MTEGKLSEPLLVTGDDGWPEYYSIAKTMEDLRRDVEGILSDGEHAVTDISLWKRVEDVPEEPERGRYVIALAYTSDGEPFDVQGEMFCHETIHQGLQLSERDNERAVDWACQVWMEVEVDIDTRTTVSGIWLPKSKQRKRRKRLA